MDILWARGRYRVYKVYDTAKSVKLTECSFGRHFSLSGDHTESIQIDYDPKVTSYRELLKMFWQNHDPTR